jgi:hypothetical protein
MNFSLKHPPFEFEIPDEWWNAAKMPGWKPETSSFAASSDASFPTILISIDEAEPPIRGPGIKCFFPNQMVPILKAFRNGIELPPIQVHRPPEIRNFSYQIRDGFHRFYASVAVGFSQLPVSVRPYFDIPNWAAER